MSFEERFRQLLHRAERSMPEGSLSYEAVLAQARRERMKVRLGVAVAVAAVIGAGVVVGGMLAGGNGPAPIPPVNTPTRSPTPQTPPSPTDDPEPAAGECSASELDADAYPGEPHPELPPAVAEMRGRIVEAALRCDYDALSALALEGRDFFSFSFGDPDQMPGEYWRMLEEGVDDPETGQPILRLLVETLELSYCTDTFDDPDGEGTVTQYAWPAASCSGPDEEAWTELEGLYSDDEIRDFRDFGSFIGWRAGIYDDGDWTFYIAGD